MAEIGSNNLDDTNEGKPVTGPTDTAGDLDDVHEGVTVVGYDIDIMSVPSKATAPDPADDAIDVAIDKTLSWADGGGAASYDVYFGTSSPPDSIGNQAGTSYDPGGLDPETEYFWRIDAVNEHGTTTGDEWSFTSIGAASTRKATQVIVIT